MTIDATPSLAGIDLINLDNYLHGPPHDVWRLLRREAPIYWHEGRGRIPGFWAVTKYDDVVAVSRDPSTWISSRGIGIIDDPAREGPTVFQSMITTDPPRHVRLRRLVNKGFTPRMVATLEPHIREITTEIIDDVIEWEKCDFVVDIAARLPVAVICEMVGVPRQDRERMFDLTNRLLGPTDPEYRDPTLSFGDSVRQAMREMRDYFRPLIADRRTDGRDDLLTVLVGAEVDGERLTEDEILSFCQLLINAGNETTRNATSGGMLALMHHPEQRARLSADRALLPTAVEEILRWVSPVMHFARVASRDTELRGQPIRAGEKVLVWYPSANRDEEVFPDPDSFDVGRTPNEHVAFGIGEHFCLGAGLARLELTVMLDELLRRLPGLELAGEVQYLRSNFLAGIKHMPVRW